MADEDPRNHDWLLFLQPPAANCDPSGNVVLNEGDICGILAAE
jgi:hypothetical protein